MTLVVVRVAVMPSVCRDRFSICRGLPGHQQKPSPFSPLNSPFLQKVFNDAGELDPGWFVGIDRVGYDILAPDERRADHVAALVGAGYTRQICLSQDCICTMASPRLPFPVPPEYNLTPASFLAGNKPLSYVVTGFSDMLRQRGVSEEALTTIFRDNPRRLLTGAD